MVIRAKTVISDRELSDSQILYASGSVFRDTDLAQAIPPPSRQHMQDTKTQRGYKEFDPDEFNK